MVKGLVIGGDALDDLHGILNGGLVDDHGLETALQSGILLNIFPVLHQCGGTNDLNFSSGQGGLENIGGIHRALGIPGAHQIMDFVDDQDDIAQLLDFLDQSLHTAFKLAAELGSCHQGSQVQQVDLLVLELVGNVTLIDFHRQPFGNGGFSHAGFSDEAGIVFLAAVEDLNDPFQLLIPSNHPIQLSLCGFSGEGDTVIFQEFPLGPVFALGFFLADTAAAIRGLGRDIGQRVLLFLPIGVGQVSHELVQEGESGSPSVFFLVVVAAVRRVAQGAGQVAQQAFHAFGPFKGRHHFRGQSLQIFITQAHFLNHISNRADIQLPGAFQAETFILTSLSVVVQPGDKDHGDIFFASAAQRWFHRRVHSFVGCHDLVVCYPNMGL